MTPLFPEIHIRHPNGETVRKRRINSDGHDTSTDTLSTPPRADASPPDETANPDTGKSALKGGQLPNYKNKRFLYLILVRGDDAPLPQIL
jgi:hypothetical protein